MNIDINPMWTPDIVADISAPWGPVTGGDPDNAAGFGLAECAGKIEVIVANDVLEHIVDLVSAMKNILALLKEGGELHAYVPYDLSYGAWQDYSHVRAFNERSWLYWTDWCWYTGLTESRFDMKSLEFALNPIGKQMKEQGVANDIILRTPRAVDGMKVILVKRLLPERSGDNQPGEPA